MEKLMESFKKFYEIFEAIVDISPEEFVHGVEVLEVIPDAKFRKETKTRFIVKTDMDRLLAMDAIIAKIPDFKRDRSITGSSIGGIRNNSIEILIKPNTKVKGGGGRAFETEFVSEFNRWCEDTSYESTYSHLFDEICKENDIDPDDLRQFSPEPMGALNQKRTLNDILNGKPSDIGETVTDVTLVNKDGKSIYLSLKIGPSFYLYNGGFTGILKRDEDRRTLLAAMGADYKRFEKDFEIETDSKFEPKIEDGEEFFTNFVKSCLGYGYTIVHENGSKSLVKKVNPSEKVVVNVKGVRYRTPSSKYFAVDLEIMMLGRKYKSQFQLRNNAGKVSPNVIYLLIGKEAELTSHEKARIS
jgi:hypothetical protein